MLELALILYSYVAVVLLVVAVVEEPQFIDMLRI